MSKKCIEYNTGARLDMEFLFEFSTPFITGEHSQRVRYRVEDQQLIGDFQIFTR